MFMCVVNLKSVNKLDLTWKQSFLIVVSSLGSLSTYYSRRNDTQHNDVQHNDPQRNETKHNDTQHNNI